MIIIDGIIVNGEIGEAEAQEYVTRGLDRFPNLAKMNIRVDGEFVEIGYELYDPPKPFERIRRITGYLVGTTGRWNNAKQAELKDRVKHMSGFDSVRKGRNDDGEGTAAPIINTEPAD